MSDPFKIIEPTVIAFSGGRTSGYMLWRVLQSNNGLPDDARIVFCNTGKEHESTLQFVKECSDKWNVHIDWIEYIAEKPYFKIVNFETASRNGEPFEALIENYQKLPNPVQRFCTGLLKLRPVHKFAQSIGWEHSYDDNADFVGIRVDEPRRAMKMKPEKIPLYTAGVTRQDVIDFWNNNDFDLNLLTFKGDAIAGNCDLCFLKGLPKIVSMIQADPSRADWWIKMESKIKDKDNVKSGNGNTFRSDRPKYEQLKEYALSQQDLFGNQDDPDIPCFCGD